MYFKLALRNLRKSFKDYTIYFLTLIFGVCIFYVFNSIKSQTIMMDLNEMQANAFNMVEEVMKIASVFISFILGFLIIYASNYLIKRRKKEFGIYMTLGMEKGRLSRIIFIETILVGVISLAIGVAIGVLVSQGLSIFTAKLFQVDLVKFRFAFSTNGFIKTVICFAIIYTIVLLFNSISIGRIKLINLLTASRKNENLKVRNIWTSVIVFLISIIMIVSAYYTVLAKGLAVFDSLIGYAVALGALGTFLFFFSLSGFLLKIVQNNRRLYLKDLNMFVLRQINSKINTTFISMTFICLMLFVAICTFSGGLGINKAINADIEDLTQFDITFWNAEGEDIEIELLNKGFDINKYSDEYFGYQSYDNKFGYQDFFSKEAVKKSIGYYPIYTNKNVPVIKVSEFNKAMRILGKDEIVLKDNEYAAFGDVDDIIIYIQEAIDAKEKINVNGHELTPVEGYKVVNATTYNQTMKYNICSIIVNDEVTEGLVANQSVFNLNLKDKEDAKVIEDTIRGSYDDENMDTYYMTKEEMVSNSVGVGAMISYLALYLGFIFLITSAAVLALQQLSESADNIERYNLLRKIGVGESMINKSIFAQVGIYFIVPLSLAIVHSIVGLKVSADIVAIFGDGNMKNYVFITAAILLVVYGGYFLSTYVGVKKMNASKS